MRRGCNTCQWSWPLRIGSIEVSSIHSNQQPRTRCNRVAQPDRLPSRCGVRVRSLDPPYIVARTSLREILESPQAHRISVTNSSNSAPQFFVFILQMAVRQISKPDELVSMVQGALRPITSYDTRRYERTGLAEPYHMQISPGLFSRSRLPELPYLPLHWSAHIHPEGQLYFCGDGPLPVVTQAYNVTRWIQGTQGSIAHRSFPISDQVRVEPELFESIHISYEAGDYMALDHSISAKPPIHQEKLRKIFRQYGGVLIEQEPGSSTAPMLSPQERESICAIGMAAIKRIQIGCERLGLNVDLNELLTFGALAQEVQDLKASCKKLEYLLRTGRSSPALRRRIETLLERIKNSPAMDEIDLVRKLDEFTQLHLEFCELSLTGQDTKATIRDLRELVQNELYKAKLRVEEFNSLSKLYYTEGGRHDLAVLMQENVRAARDAGFREGVSSTGESQWVYDELQKIDECFAEIREHLKESKKFWEKVDHNLKSAPSTPTSQQAQDVPDGITTGPVELRIEHRAQRIHTGLQNISQAAQQYCGSRKMLKTGNNLVKDASDLTKDCSTISSTQRSAEIQLQSQTCGPKSGRKALAPLRKGLGSIVKRNEKLLLAFTKYKRLMYLLFWFAGTTAAQKMRMERPDHVAHAGLVSKGLCSYVLPFESAFTSIKGRLRGTQKFWIDLGSIGDGL
ncbi:hypothetical protein B0H10DRAFT_2105980 [Mycena sp. CBHHK59/15]|nr:hypothetical protein B0H10DRAFT_2105980 [Mycena sp. CBHHK59/15]